MDMQFLQQNWALAVAAGLLAIVAVMVLVELRRQSSAGQLYEQARRHRDATRELRDAERKARKVGRKLARLEKKADRVRPRELEQVRGLLHDATALAKIASDREQVEANKLRKVIFEEFPPARHEDLRRRFLPGDGPDARPFSF